MGPVDVLHDMTDNKTFNTECSAVPVSVRVSECMSGSFIPKTDFFSVVVAVAIAGLNMP